MTIYLGLIFSYVEYVYFELLYLSQDEHYFYSYLRNFQSYALFCVSWKTDNEIFATLGVNNSDKIGIEISRFHERAVNYIEWLLVLGQCYSELGVRVIFISKLLINHKIKLMLTSKSQCYSFQSFYIFSLSF